MDEQKETDKPEDKPKDKKPEAADAGVAKGSEPKTTTLIDDANTAAERLEKANERKTELLKQEEEIMAKRALGGKTFAGQPEQPKLTEEEKASREKIKEIGHATGSKWAKDMEKEDEQK